MNWLTNIYNPTAPDAFLKLEVKENEDRNIAWEKYSKWLEDKVIGLPKATEYYTVEQLQKENLVGVYVISNQILM